jgi:hypothetical protein
LSIDDEKGLLAVDAQHVGMSVLSIVVVVQEI